MRCFPLCAKREAEEQGRDSPSEFAVSSLEHSSHPQRDLRATVGWGSQTLVKSAIPGRVEPVEVCHSPPMMACASGTVCDQHRSTPPSSAHPASLGDIEIHPTPFLLSLIELSFPSPCPLSPSSPAVLFYTTLQPFSTHPPSHLIPSEVLCLISIFELFFLNVYIFGFFIPGHKIALGHRVGHFYSKIKRHYFGRECRIGIDFFKINKNETSANFFFFLAGLKFELPLFTQALYHLSHTSRPSVL
jgi:hypothetical protein